MTTQGKMSERYEEVFENVMALYAVLEDQRHNFRVRRAEVNLSGEVPAEPLDFLLDVEIKASRVLEPGMYIAFLRMAKEGTFALLWPAHKRDLGKAFLENNLGVGGDYSSLYFRVKNDRLREYLKERDNGEGIEHNQFD